MKALIKENAIFFSCFLLFLVLATIGLFSLEQGDLIFYFSENRTPFWDSFFRLFTTFGEGLFFLAAALVMLFYKYRYALLFPILGLTVMLVSYISKAIFAHPRPLAYFRELGMADQLTFVANVDVHTGATSFPSGHTMAGFVLYCFLALVLPFKRGVAVLCFLFALGVGLSRIYLVQHFLKDVYLGSIMGVIIAVTWFLIQEKWQKPWLDRKINITKTIA